MHEGDVDKRVQYTIEALFLVPQLDLVEPEDQITHDVRVSFVGHADSFSVT